MKKMNTSPVSGMQELTPEKQTIFDNLKNKISEAYHRHGFLSIETPIIDRAEILLAKAGGDTEKQIYKVVKTAETSDDADQALRFDHTVPLARYTVEHENDLTFPFKVSQIGRNFRGERAQRGRFREFYQCDVDVIGRGELPLYYDVDVLMAALDALKAIDIEMPIVARISNRKIVTGAIEALNLREKAGDIYSIIDHSEKVPAEKTVEAFDEIGLGEEKRNKILDLIKISGDAKSAAESLKGLGISNEMFDAGVKELEYVVSTLEQNGYSEMARVDMKIVRGLDYYTGTVFEFCLPEYMGVGSIGGGGRYENLAGYFTDLKLPGVGASIGLSRLFYVLNENNLLKSQTNRVVDVAVVPISENELNFAIEVAKELAEKGETVTVVAPDKKLGDKLKYAATVAKRGIVLGEAEVSSGKYRIKEFN